MGQNFIQSYFYKPCLVDIQFNNFPHLRWTVKVLEYVSWHVRGKLSPQWYPTSQQPYLSLYPSHCLLNQDELILAWPTKTAS